MKFKTSLIEHIVDESVASDSSELARWGAAVSPPRSLRFFKPIGDGVGFLWLWAVWDSNPNRADAWLIVYDPRRQEFGCATKPYRGRYGRLIQLGSRTISDALRAM